MSDLTKAIQVTLTYLAYRPGVRSRLTEAVDLKLRAQSFESDRCSGHTTVTDDEGITMPAVSDSTGEAAISPDRARRRLMELDRAEADLIAACNRLVSHPLNTHATIAATLDAYLGNIPECNSVIRKCAVTFDIALGEAYGKKKPKVGEAHDGAPGCECCARLRERGLSWWNDPAFKGGTPTDLGGLVHTPMRLCRPCARFVLEVERLPTVAELKHKRDDPRGHWPKRYDQKTMTRSSA